MLPLSFPPGLCLVLFVWQLQLFLVLPQQMNHPCLPQESAALLHFKSLFSIDQEASDDCPNSSYPQTESWKQGTDCCSSWDGVTCDEADGHVTDLDLSCSRLRAAVPFTNTSLVGLHLLPRLRILNLAFNDFSWSQIPSDITHLRGLEYLNLSGSTFSWEATPDFSSLSNLVVLDLSRSGWLLKFDTRSFRRLVSNLTKLEQLRLSLSDMSSVNFASPINFTSSLRSLMIYNCQLHGHLREETFRQLPNLESLWLGFNPGLNGFFPQLNWSSPIEILDLSRTNLTGLLPRSIGELKQLKSLDLRDCYFFGLVPPLDNLTELSYVDFNLNNFVGEEIPSYFGTFGQLNVLNLNGNHFSGSIPASLGNLTKLTLLGLSSNNLSGQIADTVSHLTELEQLDLSSNQLGGAIPAGIFSLPLLQELDLSRNHLTGHLHEFRCRQLVSLFLYNNTLQGSIPSSLFELVNLVNLQLGLNNFSGTVELSKFSNLERLWSLDLSRNSLSVNSGQPTVGSSHFPNLDQLGLASCNLTEFPGILRNGTYTEHLDLSDNKLSGEVPSWMLEVGRFLIYLNLSHNFLTSLKEIPWKRLQTLDLHSNAIAGNIPMPPPGLWYFLFSDNKLTGGLPGSICNLGDLFVLNLSNNSLSGTIPECLLNSNQRSILDLGTNRFQGTIPDAFASNCSLFFLSLRDNRFEGPVPRSLANCTNLNVLDLGNNKLQDTFPTWLAPLPELKVLILHSNMFYGYMASSKTNISFPKLQILDVSNNKFKGPVSTKFLEHFKAMMNVSQDESEPKYIQLTYYELSIVVTLKGMQIEMEMVLNIFTTMDLSSNNFIPRLIGDLQALKVLNLSHNSFIGQIPESLAKLTEVETLDLSSNRLVGEIPQQLTSLTFLEVFNLSHNMLVGSIPQGKQFNTFGNDSYIGNQGLCGFPLSKKFNTNEAPATTQENDDSFADGFTWQAVLIGYSSGFVVAVVASHIMFLTGKPVWLIRMVERECRRIMGRRSWRHGGRRN